MEIGGALLMIAIGAILHYAVTATVAGIDIQTVGTILIVVGIIGLILGLWLEFSRARSYREPPPPPV